MISTRRVAYFDCSTGAAGDMILGALVDAGAPLARVRAGLRGLRVTGYSIVARRVARHGVSATKLDVRLERRRHEHVGLPKIRAILRGSDLPGPVRASAEAVFSALARAEARIHGIAVEKVHFHEVGAVDAIVDVVGSLLALDLLSVEEVFASPMPMSHGFVHCEHGTLPVPAPAVLGLLRGWPFFPTDLTGELVTPTAAAILGTRCAQPGRFPPMKLEEVGYGAGTRELPDRPNVLRVLIGTAPRVADPTMPPAERVWVIEASLDDATGETVAWAMDRLLAAGALDAHATPVLMKKGRPGIVLSALAPEPTVAAIEEVFLRETTTFGVRRHPVERSVLARELRPVHTPWGDVRVKIGWLDGRVVVTHPEHDDCRRSALAHGVPLRDVLAAASAAALLRPPRSSPRPTRRRHK